MSGASRRTLVFAAQFLPLLALGVWLYPSILAPYERLVLTVAGPFLGASSLPVEATVASDGALEARLITSAGSEPLYEKHYRPDAIFLSLILLPPLILATPLPLRRRLTALGVGMVLMFALHAFAIVGLIRTYLCLKNDPRNFLCAWTKGFVLTSGQVGAVVFWALLTWSYWLPALGIRATAPAGRAPGRNDPCPCGSGLKFKKCCALEG